MMKKKRSLFTSSRGLTAGTRNLMPAVITAPVMAALLATIGNGLYTTLTSLQIAKLTDDSWLMGVSLAIYFFGLMLGTIFTQLLIRKLEHRYCYYWLCLMTVVGTLLQALSHSLLWWMPIRLMLGFALGGMFVFYETWINQHSPKARRPYYLSIYFAIYYIALALGQLFLQLPMAKVQLMYGVVAGLTILSVLPFIIFRRQLFDTPKPTLSFMKLSDIAHLPLLGLLGSLVSGLLSGVVISLMPYFLTLRNVSHDTLSWLMLATMLSGVLPQLFIARLARKFRAQTLLIACSVTLGFAVVAELLPTHTLQWMMIASPIIGACVFSIYPISVNMIVDAVPAAKITSANSLTLFVYSLGCSLGPLLCSLWMGESGDEGYLYFLLLFCVALSVAALRRRDELSLWKILLKLR